MRPKDPSATGIAIFAALWASTCAVTIWLSYAVTTRAARPSTFAFDVVFLCVLETLVYGYFALVQWRRMANRLAGGLVPALGVLILLYTALSTALVLGHWLLASSAQNHKWYFILLVVESLLFFIVLGLILALNAHKTSEDSQQSGTAARTRGLEYELDDALNDLIRVGAKIGKGELGDAESALRRAKEKVAYGIPFGGVGSAAAVEAEIGIEVSSIRQSLSRASTQAGSEVSSVLDDVRRRTSRLLELLARRDRVIVR
jgi:hypothetical protein